MGGQKVIIDCDPGIDDSMALFMALASQAKGELEILAITLVAGNTALDNCARNAIRVLETVGKDSQVHTHLSYWNPKFHSIFACASIKSIAFPPSDSSVPRVKAWTGARLRKNGSPLSRL